MSNNLTAKTIITLLLSFINDMMTFILMMLVTFVVSTETQKTDPSNFLTALECENVKLLYDESENAKRLLYPIVRINSSIFSEQNDRIHLMLYLDRQIPDWPILNNLFGVITNNIHTLYLSEVVKTMCADIINENHYKLVPKINSIIKKLTPHNLGRIPTCVYSTESKLDEAFRFINSFVMNTKYELSKVKKDNYNTTNLIVDLLKNIYTNLHTLISCDLDKKDYHSSNAFSYCIERCHNNIHGYVYLLCNIFDRLEQVLEIYKQAVTRQSNKNERIKAIFEQEF